MAKQAEVSLGAIVIVAGSVLRNNPERARRLLASMTVDEQIVLMKVFHKALEVIADNRAAKDRKAAKQ